MSIKLSICIPTYNRASYIGDTLKSITSQASDEIEIIVSDNASQDNTEEIVQDFMKHFPQITYFRWDCNMGADQNYLKVIELAKGDYCWFMGSDDIAKPGAIARIKKELEQDNCDIILVNRDSCNIEMQKCKKNRWHISHEDMMFDTNTRTAIVEYLNGCISLGGVFSYLSAIVVRKSRWDEYGVPSKYMGTAYSHVYPLLCLLRDGAKLKCIDDSLVLCRGGNDSFLNGNKLRRMLIDYRGYSLLADDIFVENDQKLALYSILAREHPLYRIIAIGFEANDEDWVMLAPYLDRLYPKSVLHVVGLLRRGPARNILAKIVSAAKKIKAQVLDAYRD